MDSKVYDRWLKGAEVWIQEDDWSPDEYFKWIARLAEAKANLDETFLEVDNKLLAEARKMVPIEEAVHNHFRYYEEKIKRTDPVGLAYNSIGLRSDTYLLVSMLQNTRVDGGPVDRSKIGEMFKVIDEYKKNRGSYTHGEEKAARTMAFFDTDEKMELFLERCMEPMVSHESQDSNATAGIKYLVEEGEFKKLLDLTVAEEKQHCSWEATVGPAIKALRRLGRTSAGKDMNKLADYAKTHQKPQIA
ncbi:hypothetical protein FIE12Z_8269 [Fusarium flagelliforme]|uniref:Uncharacterized protein n=1 Tax=Fusarium flagelliforme TaxID=2675880 RepID=A0A395MHV0_9HYPO|nr:hypothetical protein FIE12Z_8269 [Fusarium flagelliforme]